MRKCKDDGPHGRWRGSMLLAGVLCVCGFAPLAAAQDDDDGATLAGLNAIFAELGLEQPTSPSAPSSDREVQRQAEEDRTRPRGTAAAETYTGEPRPSLPESDGDDITRLDTGPFEGTVTVSEEDLVDLHVVNEDLLAVLQLLSIQSRRNIVTSNQVSAVITADLYGVTFYEALDAILNVNGFGYVERGSFIYVYTREELDELSTEGRNLTSAVIRLDYLNAPDAAEFATPLLSEEGSITAPGETLDFDIPDDAPVGKDDFPLQALIVVHDYSENVEAIADLIEQIDTRPEQVLIEATILQTTLNEANAFGVDFSLIADLEFSQFISPLSATEGLIGGRGSALVGGAETPVQVPSDGIGRSVSSTVGNTAGEAGLRAGIVGEDVAVFVRALDEVTDVNIVSNPKILTLNRQQARVLVGTRFGYLQTTTTETSTTQTVEFLDTGTQLHVRPFVTDEGLIRLELKPQVSSASSRAVTASNGQTVTIPDEDTTELVTNLIVRDGQTVVLGGLFTETTTATRRQVPVFGDIPVVGAAFRGNDDSTRRSEIIFLVTPSIVSEDVLTLEGERATEYVEHARTGARKGLLPWSRERQVGKLLIEAQRLADAGDESEAMLKIQRALALHPQSVEAIALREELTRRSTRFPSRSMLDGIIDEAARRIASERSTPQNNPETSDESVDAGENDRQFTTVPLDD